MELDELIDAKMCIAVKDFDTCTEEEFEENDIESFDKVKKDSKWEMLDIRESEIFDGYEVFLQNIESKDNISLPVSDFENYMKIIK